MHLSKACFVSAELALLSLCIYAATSYSENPRQWEFKDAYSDLKILYFTYISLYYTIITSVTGLVYVSLGIFRTAFHHMMWTSPVFNSITTSTFWILYFCKREYIVNKRFLKPGYETYLLTELSLHLFPLVLSYMQQFHIELKRSRVHYLVFAVIVATYCAITHVANHMRGAFIYPFLNEMNSMLRAAFFIGIFGCCILFYNMFMFVNHRCSKLKQ